MEPDNKIIKSGNGLWTRRLNPPPPPRGFSSGHQSLHWGAPRVDNSIFKSRQQEPRVRYSRTPFFFFLSLATQHYGVQILVYNLQLIVHIPFRKHPLQAPITPPFPTFFFESQIYSAKTDEKVCSKLLTCSEFLHKLFFSKSLSTIVIPLPFRQQTAKIVN
jgi:hypothetical protein